MPAVFPVASHTDNVGVGSTFVAIKGLNGDGTQYIEKAITKGATRIVIQEGIVFDHPTVEVISVANPRKALAELSAQAAGYPARSLKIVGVTGTKGKTTSVYLLNYLLKKAGYKTALLSTIKNSIADVDMPACMTTAQPDYLHQFFKLCVENSVDYVVMEVAAQATTFERLETITFDGLIFTNLDREHAELYPTMEGYFAAKQKIFEYAKSTAKMVTNADDLYGAKIAQQYHKAVAFSFKDGGIKWSEGALKIGDTMYTYANLPGFFNAYNLTGVLLLLEQLGIKIAPDLGVFPAIPGRLQRIDLANGARAFIDYAHTPGSFKSVLATVRQWTQHLIVVFGAGGGKDPIKRPLMGAIASEYADLVVLTDDNPRQEDSQKIMQNILAGVADTTKVLVEHDRAKAIHLAYERSGKDSIIILLGKGPDEYQEIGTKKIPFSEKAILQALS